MPSHSSCLTDRGNGVKGVWSFYYTLTLSLAGCRVPTTGTDLLLNVVGRPVASHTQSMCLVVALAKTGRPLRLEWYEIGYEQQDHCREGATYKG